MYVAFSMTKINNKDARHNCDLCQEFHDNKIKFNFSYYNKAGRAVYDSLDLCPDCVEANHKLLHNAIKNKEITVQKASTSCCA